MFSIPEFVILLLAANVVLEITAQLEPMPVDKQILNAGGIHALDMFHVMQDGTVMVKRELDILTPLDEFSEMMAAANSPTRRKKAMIIKNRWPITNINYDITDKLRDYAHVIRTALSQLSNFTCLNFVERYGDYAPRIRYDRWGYGTCAAHPGYVSILTSVNLMPGCEQVDIVQHETLHILGVYHEQSRKDRDKYLELPPKLKTHRKWEIKDIYLGQESLGIEYDYRSLMHYEAWDGVRTKDPSYQNKIGHYHHLSFRDIKLLNAVYCTTRTCLECKYRPPCPFNGMRIPKKLYGQPECQCWCDSGKPYNQDQFVLCKSLEKSMEPVYNLTLESSLLETEYETCRDMLDNCMSLRKKGLCFTELVKMKNLCTKTCNFCGKGQDLCMDNDESCIVMAEAGVCQDKGLEQFMNDLCPKSCGQCTKHHSACDIQKAMEEPGSNIVSAATINSHWITIFVVFCVLIG